MVLGITPAAGATGYNLGIVDQLGVAELSRNLAPSQLSFQVSNLTPGVAYTFTLTAQGISPVLTTSLTQYTGELLFSYAIYQL